MKASGSAYIVAHRNGWLEHACRHMTPRLKTWDKASVVASASKYTKPARWKEAEAGAYKAAARHGWLEEATAQMNGRRHRWTLKNLEEDAQKHQTRSAWKEANGAAYKAARDRGVLDYVCAHMNSMYRPAGWWNIKQHVIDSARNFQSLQMWNEAETSAVQAARRSGWIDEATAHMCAQPMPIGPATIHEFLLSHNIPYVAEHRFKHAPEVAKMPFDFYMPQLRIVIEYHGRQHKEGWSRDKDSLARIRKNDRIKKKWAIAYGLEFVEIRAWTHRTVIQVRKRLTTVLRRELTTPRQLTPDESRRISSGYAWDEESLMRDAGKYKSRSEWMRNSPRAYRFALRHELADHATRHMERLIEPGKWTKQAVLADASKYVTKLDWRTASRSAYAIATRKGWLREACEHMKVGKAPNGYWTAERILSEAARFENTADWNKGSPVSYGIAKKRRLVPGAMPRKKKPHGFWSKERIALTAATFKTKGEFRVAEPSAYSIAVASGWLREVCAHMFEPRGGSSSSSVSSPAASESHPSPTLMPVNTIPGG
jgi:very-short-patch-repair endonuclease